MRGNQYDAAITMFSPEGRMYQVEYALELVKQGAPIVGVYSPEGVVLAANETPASVLEDTNYYRKIFQFDEHIGTAIAGLSSDARLLIDQGRVYCQSNKLLYDESADVDGLVETLSNRIQQYTQHGGVRPYGVSMLVAGVDTVGPKLLTTDPFGTYRGYLARAMCGDWGGGEQDASRQVRGGPGVGGRSEVGDRGCEDRLRGQPGASQCEGRRDTVGHQGHEEADRGRSGRLHVVPAFS